MNNTDINSLAQRLREAAKKSLSAPEFGSSDVAGITRLRLMKPFADLARPKNILTLLDALEAAQRQVAHLQNSEREWEEANSNLNIGIKNAASRIKDLESNNKNLVERCKLLRERPDLPVDRIPAFKLLVKAQSRIAELEASQPVVHEGWKLVPLKATKAMKDACDYTPGPMTGYMAWKVMIEAAPVLQEE